MTDSKAKSIIDKIEAAIPTKKTVVTDSQPVDKRSVTSAENGKKGGRPETDLTALANSFTDEHKNSPFRYFRGSWYRYNGNFYYQYPYDDFMAIVVAWLQKKLKKQRIGRALSQDFILNLKTLNLLLIPSDTDIPAMLNTFEHKPYLLALQNGILDLEYVIARKGKTVLQPLTPDFFSTSGFAFSYDSAAKCPIFKKFLNDVQPTKAGREMLQMLFGLALVQDCRYEVAFYLYGPSGTGKSVFLYILSKMIGKTNVTCVPLHRFIERFSLHLLTSHRLNIVGDMAGDYSRFSLAAIEGIFKDVVSGGKVDCERKGRDVYTAPATALNIFASNSLIEFSDKSSGIWDRLRVIPFTQVFRGTNKENNRLKEEIVASELPGIFDWAVEGLVKLRALKRFPEHPAGLELKNEHRNECDHERNFLSSHFEECAGERLSSDLLFKRYKAWSLTNSHVPVSSGAFNQSVQLTFSGVIKSRAVVNGKKVTCWGGLRRKL